MYANKISSSYGLLIQVGDNEPYGVDVSSDIVVLACNQIVTYYSDGSQRIKTYDRSGNYTTSDVPALNNSEATETKEKVKTK